MKIPTQHLLTLIHSSEEDIQIIGLFRSHDYPYNRRYFNFVAKQRPPKGDYAKHTIL
jgi:hypothetical protein